MNRYRFSLLLAIATYLLVSLIFGVYLENSEKMIAGLVHGNIVDPPYNNWFRDDFLFQMPAISFLSKHMPKVPVWGIWHLIIMIVRLSVWFNLSIRIFGRLIKNKAILILISCLFVWAVTATSLTYVYYLRDAVLLASGSLLLYLDYYIYDNRKPKALILLFLFSCMLRVSAAILVILPVSVLMGLYLRNPKKLFDALKFQWLIAILCLTVVEGSKLLETDPAIQAEAKIESRYEYAIQDREAVVPLSAMKTALDTVRYQALTRYFLVMDSAQINVDFIRRCLDDKKYMYFGLTRDDVDHFLEKGLPVIQGHQAAVLLFYLLIAIGLWGASRKTIISMILFNLFCWSTILIIGFKINIFEYFFVPWLSVPIGGSVWLISTRQTPLKKLQKVAIFIIALMIFIIEVKNINKISSREISSHKDATLELKKIEALTQKSVPVIWTSDDSFLPTDLFTRSETNVIRKCIYMNLFYGLYYDWAQGPCLRRFGFSPLDWKKMGLTFNKNGDKVCFIMDDNFAQFLTYYYKNIYNINFKLVKNNPVVEINPNNYVYHLEKE